MKINIIGFSKVEYVNKQGRSISGSQLFAIGDSSAQFTKGQVWIGKRTGFNFSPIFVPSSIVSFDRLSCGGWEINFDLNGNVSCMEKLKID